MTRYYCDYCDTYLTHDSVSDLTSSPLNQYITLEVRREEFHMRP